MLATNVLYFAAPPTGDLVRRIVQTVAEALCLPYAAVALERDGGCAVDRGRRWRTSSPRGAAAAELSRGSGWASCAWRPARRARASRRPTTISCRSCTDAGPAGQAVRLTADLQRSRKRLVAAREEERRRLRRDLHVGLGPALPAQILKSAPREHCCRGMGLRPIGCWPDSKTISTRRLSRSGDWSTTCVRQPWTSWASSGHLRERRAVYDGGQWARATAETTVEAPDQLPPMPAAVEVAAYRIVQEALANVARHARASTCQSRLRLDDALCIEIMDDGVGLLA